MPRWRSAASLPSASDLLVPFGRHQRITQCEQQRCCMGTEPLARGSHRAKPLGDTVATQALRTLAKNADYLLVDTWHATHEATAAIDAVRPRNNQIMPKGHGISGFLRALEGALQPDEFQQAVSQRVGAK
jgi:hypothetical protein